MKTKHLPITSIAELHRILELPPPAHPLVSVIDMSAIPCAFDSDTTHVTYSFYSVCIKNGFKGKLKYGQNFYDFDNGVMTFFQPNQAISTVVDPDNKMSGWWLVFHPEFLLGYGLSSAMRNYGYFSYAVHEALHLSDKEEKLITAIMQQIAAEYDSPIDNFSQDVMISQIELVLNYCNRFYNRQFITRKHANTDLLIRLEAILDDYFTSGKLQEIGLPSVQLISDQLHISPNYLSDLLRTQTGQSTQQHIQDKLINKAKDILATTDMTVSEIAYMLGFGYPQSFSKLFKNKTNLSPLAFRQGLN